MALPDPKRYSNWRQFSTAVQRSLPSGTTFEERGRAMKAAGKLWRGEGSGEDWSDAMQRNPEVLGIDWKWIAGGIALLWLMGKQRHT